MTEQTDTETVERVAKYWADWADDVERMNGAGSDVANMRRMMDTLRALASERDRYKARAERIREEALREAEKTARDYGKHSYAAKMISDAINDLIKKEQTNEQRE